MADELICIGAIAGAFGVQGEVRLKSFCADPAAIADYAPLSDKTGARSFTVVLTKSLNGAFAARLGGVTSREQAEALKGTQLFAPRTRLPALPDDEFYHSDLVGLVAVDTGGAVLGKVATVQNHGAGDILEIRNPKGALLVPFTRACVPTVDLAARRVVVDPPDESE
ncbi:MAG: ribosome maturation factor RimM [Paracoccaceae bacterium]